MSGVEVLRIAPVQGRGNLWYLVDVRVDGWVLRRCRVIQEPGKRAYVSLPQQEIPTRDGGRAYVTLVTPPVGVRERIERAVLQDLQSRGLYGYEEDAGATP